MTTSRRDFLATSIGAALAAALVRPGAARALLPGTQEPAFRNLRRNVGIFTMRGGTVGYLVNDGGVVVVDSQFPAEAAALLQGLNSRSGNRPVDYLINTHHHGDHSGGNIAFRGSARQVVAHHMADEHMRQPPGGQPPTDQLFPDTTFDESWSADVGDEQVRARYYGRAHTSGDAVITFERANVVHMGDLMFNRRHPVVDGPAGAIMRNWAKVLDRTVQDHDNETVYIFGHANTDQPLTGSAADLARFRDYLLGVVTFVEEQVRAGRPRDEILAMRDPLRGFEEFGRFGQASARDPLTVAYQEVSGGS
jgi:cyclase